MRVVLDTNILVRANPRAKGPARSLLLEIAKSDQHTLILSPFLIEETERVLNYPRMQALWPLSADEIQRYLQLLDDSAELVHPRSVVPVVLRDPNDDPVIERRFWVMPRFSALLTKISMSPRCSTSAGQSRSR